MNKKIVLVTGAAGFVGSNLVRKLLDEKEYKIHAIIRESSDIWRIKDIISKLKVHYADLNDYNSLKKAVNDIKPTHILHLATYGAYPRTQTEIEKIIKINYIGTFNLIMATMELPYEIFINTGTTSEYGIKTKAMKENDNLDPDTIYGAVKAGNSILCRAIARAYNKNICTLRLFSVYGPYEEKNRLFSYVIANSLLEKDIEVSSGIQSRDFIYVDDVCEAYLRAMKNASKLKGKIINIGTGKQTKIKDAICQILNINSISIKDSRIKWGKKELASFESTTWKADITQSIKLLRWKPKNNLYSGIKKDIEWFKKNIKYYK